MYPGSRETMCAHAIVECRAETRSRRLFDTFVSFRCILGILEQISCEILGTLASGILSDRRNRDRNLH